MGVSQQILLKKKQLLLAYLWTKKLKKREIIHVHPINQTRSTDGEFCTLMTKLHKHPARFLKYFRMCKDKIYQIYNLIEQDLKPKSVRVRQDTIRPLEKMVITLRFLATGASFVDLSFRFRMGVSTVKKVVDQTIVAIISKCLKIAMPDNFAKEDWRTISDEFFQRWNFPNCLGAIDGKHVLTFAPKNSGSLYYNYKKTFSINLMAVVDAKYRFLMVDVDAFGSNADSTVFSNYYFGNTWLNNPSKLNISPLPRTTTNLPYVMIGDEAFALKPTILRPFPGHKLSIKERLINYRLSRARRVVENAFGILAQTWRILLKRLEVQKDSANNIVLACCILHNFLRINIPKAPAKHSSVNNTECLPEAGISALSASRGYDVRAQFAEWRVSEGDLEFQHRMI